MTFKLYHEYKQTKDKDLLNLSLMKHVLIHVFHWEDPVVLDFRMTYESLIKYVEKENKGR